jgi:branched-chain amino acid transport system substrate-binding protein
MFKKTVVAALVAGAMMSAQAADKVKVGFLSTLSGPAAPLGVSVLDGFNLALKKTGGKLGGIPVEVLVQDDQGKPDVARQLGEKFIKKDKVDFVTGLIFQNILSAVDQATFASQTFLVSSNSGPSYLAGERCNPYFFAVSWISDSYAEAAGQLLTQKGHKNVTVVAPNYPGGKDVIQGFKRYYKGTVADENYVKMGELDFSTELAQIRSKKPDAVFFFLPGGMGINFLKQWNQSGLSGQIPLYATGWNFDQDTLGAIGDSTLGSQHAAHWNTDLDNPQNKEFVADFEKEYKHLPSVYASQGYDTAMLLDAAVRDVKGKLEDKVALRKALEAANFKSVRGDFKFNTNHYPIQTYFSQLVVKDAKGRVVNKTTGKIFEAHPDAYVGACKMPKA